MAANFQRQSLIRKLIYLGLIVLLFTTTLLYRRAILEPRATNLQMRESDFGEVELASSAVRLTLFGSRGLATCVLWQMAIERQKRHEWNEMELLVNSITKLQPHFVSPWLFQSWNLAFNVSVECDRPRDKYFYVSRGLQLLAEGERRHQGTINASEDSPKFPGNPDMRFFIGMYYQMKIGNSDEKNVMKCLFDMSCIDPVDREPDRFWQDDARGRRVVDSEAFKDFCLRYPRLVRRLKSQLNCSYPKDVVDFLDKNRDVPSRFKKQTIDNLAQTKDTPLLSPRSQFPILPPPVLKELPDRTVQEFREDLDVFATCRAWYQYAQLPLPEPERDVDGKRPEVDPMKHRLPKMMWQIFRGYPARAQEYYAENLENEGWFDEDGWVIEGWFGDGLTVDDDQFRVGTERKYHARPAWQLAYEMVREYGLEAGLFIPEDEMRELEAKKQFFIEKTGISPGGFPGDLSPEERAKFDGQMGEALDAYRVLFWWRQHRQTTNYDEHYNTCATEKLPEVIQARKKLFRAGEYAAAANTLKATELYDEALNAWMAIMLTNQEFRQVSNVVTEAYERQLRHIRLQQDRMSQELQDITSWMARVGQVSPNPNVAQVASVYFPLLDSDEKRRIVPIRNVRGRFEMTHIFVDESRAVPLQSALLAITNATMPVPFALSQTHRDNMLTVVDMRTDLPESWQSLIPSYVVQSVRDRLGLNRGQPRAEQPPPGN